MADYLCATLFIPTRFLTEEILKEIEENEWDQKDENNGISDFTDYQARNGWFEELEEFLKKHQVPFDRTNDSKYDIRPEVRHFRPDVLNEKGLPYDASFITSEQGGDIVIESSKLWSLLESSEPDLVGRFKELLDKSAPRVKPLADYIEEVV